MTKFAIFALVLCLVATGFGKGKKNESQEPVVWGLLSQNAGCVIFKEYSKTTGAFWVIAATSKTVSGLEVVETRNYKLEPAKWLETEENLDELQQRAMTDKLKYVKLPDKYSSEQLARARTMCKEASPSQ
jgi:hypothetical protein